MNNYGKTSEKDFKFEEDTTEKFSDHINFIKHRMIEKILEKIDSFEFLPQSNKTGAGNTYVEIINSYKKFLIDLYQSPTMDPEARKELFTYNGEFIDSKESNVIIKTINHFLDRVIKNIMEFKRIPYTTAKYLYYKMTKENRKKFESGFNPVIDKNSMRVIEAIARQMNEEEKNKKNTKEKEYKFSQAEIDSIEDQIFIAVIRSIISNSIGITDREQRLSNDIKVLDRYTDPKGPFSYFRIFSTLDSFKKSIKINSEKQLKKMCSEYLLSLLNEDHNTKQRSQDFNLKNLSNYKDYDWIIRQEKIKLSRPVSIQMPKFEEDEKEDILGGITKKITDKISGSKNKAFENIQKKGEKSIDNLLNGLFDQLGSSISESLGQIPIQPSTKVK